MEENITVEQQLRRFLLVMTAVIFVGSIFELILVDHTEETLQWIPFILCGMGLISVMWVRWAPNRLSLIVLRWVMGGVALGSLVGIYLHFNGNVDFVHEIHPSYSLKQAFWPALKGGNPLIAPGILYLAGMLGLAATYEHPALERKI